MFKKLSMLALASVLTLGIVSPALAYEVKSGDTMTKIASMHDMSLQELATLNPQIKNINLIYVGENVNTVKGQTVESKPTVTKPVTSSESVSDVSSKEVNLLARLVQAEAESEPYTGKVAVAEVVLNRVKSSQFPNSIESVIYQKGQFTPAMRGTLPSKADSESIKAVNAALTGNTNYAKGALYFYNPRIASSSWFNTLETTSVIAGHTFKK